MPVSRQCSLSLSLSASTRCDASVHPTRRKHRDSLRSYRRDESISQFEDEWLDYAPRHFDIQLCIAAAAALMLNHAIASSGQKYWHRFEFFQDKTMDQVVLVLRCEDAVVVLEL